MHEFNGSRELDVMFAGIAAHPCRGQSQHGANALAPGIDQVAGNFRDEFDMALGPRQDTIIDPFHILRNQPNKRIKTGRWRIITAPKGNDHTHKVAILFQFTAPRIG